MKESQKIQAAAPGKWWQQVKSLSGTKNTEISGTFINVVQSEADGNYDLFVDKLNNFFIGISTSLPKLDYSPEPISNSQEFFITKDDVEKRLMSTKLKKSIGPDQIPNWVLRDCAPLISGPVTSIFNMSIKEGYIPTLWKCARVSPIPKVYPVTNFQKDIRPISVTSVLSKHLEHFIYSEILHQVEDKIDPDQYGALKGQSTIHALLRMTNSWYANTDDNSIGNIIRILFIDYSKAFDRINPNILITKLKHLGLNPLIINWIAAFISDRQQFVNMGKWSSILKDIWGNLPQGTILGVLLFLLMISDLKPDSETIKFVDDTTSFDISNEMNNRLQDSANYINDWSRDNDMCLNRTKTKEMIICFKKDYVPPPNIIIDDEVIEQVNTFKLLGVIITSDLKWSSHVDYITKKVSQRIYNLIVLRRAGLSKRDLFIIYCCMIRSVLEYGAEIWHPGLSQIDSNKLESVQRRCLKIICGEIPYEVALQRMNTQSLHDRRQSLCLKFFNSMLDPLHKLHDLLPKANTPRYPRGCTYPRPLCKTSRYKNSFVPYCLFNFTNDCR